MKEEEKKSYASPTVEKLGAVRDLTLGSRSRPGSNNNNNNNNGNN